SCSSRLRLFFFSSRRRHTRLVSDWSSDVCSSDLCWLTHASLAGTGGGATAFRASSVSLSFTRIGCSVYWGCTANDRCGSPPRDRSEERRVGKECKARGGAVR